MEAVVIASAGCGWIVRSGRTQVERLRHGPSAALLSVLIGLMLVLSHQDQARGQAEERRHSA